MRPVYWIDFFDREAERTIDGMPARPGDRRWLLTDDLAKVEANFKNYGPGSSWQCAAYTPGAKGDPRSFNNEVPKEPKDAPAAQVAAGEAKLAQDKGPTVAPRSCFLMRVEPGTAIEFFTTEAELKVSVRQKRAEWLRPKLAAGLKKALAALGHVALLALNDELVEPAALAWNELGREMAATLIKTPIHAYIAPFDVSLKQTPRSFTSI